MKKTKKALSLVIAISITLIMGLLALYILEYMIPFSRNTKNIEHSVAAYYGADSAIEDALYSMSWALLDFEKSDILDSSLSRDYSIEMDAKGKILPPSWKWNSEFDKNYNIIRIWEPIQIEVWNNLITNLSDFEIIFKVPDLDSNSNSSETLSGWTLKIINWQLSGKDDILNANNTQITADNIDWNGIVLWSKDWLTLNDTIQSFSNFYSSNCGASNPCKLKMSVINKLELTDRTSVPYLEWKIESNNEIPLRYRVINVVWKSHGFRKDLNIKVPQQTVNEAFDFTVFQ
jgi:hypothetical protein